MRRPLIRNRKRALRRAKTPNPEPGEASSHAKTPDPEPEKGSSPGEDPKYGTGGSFFADIL
ncbi:hypothetical protein JW964_18665 [candidate division KSB1 bacterium]|nr:hypothetical protein [candidate division KSB1 bacterium]